MVKQTNKKTKTYKKKRTVKIPRNNTKLIKQVAQAVIDKNTEDKSLYHTTGDATLLNFNSVINSTGDYIQLIPSGSASVEENGRVGDKITIQSFNIKGYLRFTPNVTGNVGSGSMGVCQVGIRMMILSLKKASSWDLVIGSATPLLSLLRRGGTTVGFSGQIADLHNSINTELFTVHHDKVYYMSQTFTGQSTAVGYWETDVSNQIKFFNYRMKCKKKVLVYDDDSNAGLLPVNYAPFALFGYAYLNAQGADVGSSMLGVQLQTEIKYQDL